MKICFLFFFFSLFLRAQTKDAPQIKTVMILGKNNRFSKTTHDLNTPFSFSFDDLSTANDNYRYLIRHCDINWQPSQLIPLHYIEGLEDMPIINFGTSMGTLKNYTHYEFSIPNENTRIVKSGNYLIQILNDKEEVVCERKLILYERKIAISLQISQSPKSFASGEKQSLSMVIDSENLPVNYPEKEIQTFIYQNGDLQIRSPFLRATFIENNIYSYRFKDEMKFISGNEFYHFDNSTLPKKNNFIENSYRKDNDFYTILSPKKNRNGSSYRYNPDINGDFLIRKFNSNNPKTQSEYSQVVFSLLNDEKFDGKKIHVYGAFNNYQIGEDTFLKLDDSKNYLTVKLLLKQGFYNYDFISVENDTIDRKIASGSFFETENNYEAVVYFQSLNSSFYEVVGYQIANSKH